VRYGLPVRLLLSAFIVFHIVATLLWVMPRSDLHNQVRSLTWNYISHVGLWQHWGMFAPQPSNLNAYLSAVVTYQDGSRQEWTWPRMAELDLVAKYPKERYRKFAEYARMDRFAFMWPSLAQYAAEVNTTDPTNPPVQVQLWRHWWFVPPPPANGDFGEDVPPQWNHYQFFDLPLTPAEVQ
jgi:hypothetical protein